MEQLTEFALDHEHRLTREDASNIIDRPRASILKTLQLLEQYQQQARGMNGKDRSVVVSAQKL